MNSLPGLLLVIGASLGRSITDEAGGGDVLTIALLVLIILFFGWLVVAAVRKKLSSSEGRLGKYQKDEKQEEKAVESTARLWTKARKKAEGDEEPEEQEELGSTPVVEIQTELLEKARERREAKLAADQVITTPEHGFEAVPRTLEEALKKTREGFFSRLGRMFGKTALGAEEREQIEEILFTADIGVRTSQRLIDFLQEEIDRQGYSDPNRLLTVLKQKINTMLSVDASLLDTDSARPFVILVAGVNGTGKTTTIGKLALQHTRTGKKVILAAADTFRAAAAEQLTIWGQRSGAQVVCGKPRADPGSVVYDAINTAKGRNADMVIVDTAGRLHTKVNLIEELRKVHRVCGKAMQGAPHEILLVLDATTGQNAINQAQQFHKALGVTGIVLTKLDGTAKGGVIIGICDTFGIPVRYIGVGEQVEDLHPFDPAPFVEALFS